MRRSTKTGTYYDWESVAMYDYELEEADAIRRIRASLQARLEGQNKGGDIEVMRLVDEIVEKEGAERWYDSSSSV